MQTVRIYVGEGFKPHTFVQDMLQAGTIQGATITESVGYWTDPNGEVLAEPAAIITLAVDYQDLEGIRDDVRGQLTLRGEHSAMVELADGTVTFWEAGA